jgi:hypothetical protein
MQDILMILPQKIYIGNIAGVNVLAHPRYIIVQKNVILMKIDQESVDYHHVDQIGTDIVYSHIGKSIRGCLSFNSMF